MTFLANWSATTLVIRNLPDVLASQEEAMSAELSELFVQFRFHEVVSWLDEVGHGNLKAPCNFL